MANGDSSTAPQGETDESAAERIAGLLTDDDIGGTEQPDKKRKQADDADEADDELGSDEDAEGTEPDGDDEESDESGDEEGDEEESDPPRKVKVKVDGQDVEVTEDELLRGYSRTQDYTRKTQALAEDRRKFEEESATTRAQRQTETAQVADYLARLRSAAEALAAEPDWEKLQVENPDGYPQAHAAWVAHQNRLKQIEAAQAKVRDEQEKLYAEGLKAETTRQKELLAAAIPEWTDPAVATAEKKEMVEFAKTIGFTAEELANTIDHRPFVLLRLAMMHARAQKTREKVRDKVTKATKSATKPGTPDKSTSSQRRMNEARQRLAKSGRLEDAAAVIEAML